MIPRSGPIARRVRPTRKRAKPRRQAATLRDPDYRAWIASLPCVLIGRVAGHRCHFQHIGALHQHGVKSFAAAFPGIDLELLAKEYEVEYQRRCDPTTEGAA